MGGAPGAPAVSAGEGGMMEISNAEICGYCKCFCIKSDGFLLFLKVS